MSMSDLHAEYEAAVKAETETKLRFAKAERAMWDAKFAWDDARRRTQAAFVALANADHTPTPKTPPGGHGS